MATLSVDYLPPELAHLIALATEVLNEHTNERGWCVVCGFHWPCQRVELAAFTLDGV